MLRLCTTLCLFASLAAAQYKFNPFTRKLDIAGGVGAQGPPGAIASLGGQTGGTQTFSSTNDTNVTLLITSGANNHGFAVSWTGALSVTRGGTGTTGLTGVLRGNGASPFSVVTGTASDCVRVDGSSGSCGTGGGGAPTTSTYITQTADAALSNEQALSSLITGPVKVTGGTGVLASGPINLASEITGTLPVGGGGTGVTSGTSGGIPYYATASTMNSSSALTAGKVVLGGGTGASPTSATQTGVATLAAGTLGVVAGTATDCVKVNGTSGACGSGTGAAQTPWTSAIDAAAFSLTNVDTVEVIRHLDFKTAGNTRWLVGKGGTESGSNTGSEWAMHRYTDAGTYLGSPLIINRQTGRVGINDTFTPAYPLDVAGDVNITGTYRVNGTPISAGPGGSSHPADIECGTSFTGTTITMFTGATAPKPCVLRWNNWTQRFTGTATTTINSGTATCTGYLYVSEQGVIKFDVPTSCGMTFVSNTGGMTPANVTTPAFPIGSIPVARVTITAGAPSTFTAIEDNRAIFSTFSAVGTNGVKITQSSGSTLFEADETVPRTSGGPFNMVGTYDFTGGTVTGISGVGGGGALVDHLGLQSVVPYTAATEATLATTAIPGGTLAAGECLQVEGFGSVSTGTPSTEYRLYFGATSILFWTNASIGPHKWTGSICYNAGSTTDGAIYAFAETRALDGYLVGGGQTVAFTGLSAASARNIELRATPDAGSSGYIMSKWTTIKLKR